MTQHASAATRAPEHGGTPQRDYGKSISIRLPIKLMRPYKGLALGAILIPLLG